MAELNLGTSLSADDYLDLVTAVNRRRNKSNAMLRGLGALTGVTPTMRSSSGFDTSLRAYSKAKDEEILGKIMGFAADHHFPSENHYRDWYSEQGFPEKMYEKSIAEYRKRAGRLESRLAAEHQVKMRPGLYEKQQLEITAAEKEAIKKKDTKYADDVASQIAMNAYDYVQQGMDSETALETAIDEQRSKWKKGNISGGPDSPFARSAYVDARGKFDKLVKGEEAPVQVYDTREGELRFMPPTEIAAINEETPGTILPPGEKPADVTDTSEMKALKERRKLVIPVSDAPFNEMTEEQQAETRKNYLTLTQLVRSGQRQNVLLQNLTQGQIAKNTYDQIKMIVDIEDPEFFQRTFGVANEYEMYHTFKVATEGMKPEQKELEEKKFVRRAVQRSGWDADHIYSIIRPDRFGLGVKYERFRVGG